MAKDSLAVGLAVIQRRVQLGYETQKEAAAAARVSPTTWGHLEHGRLSSIRAVNIAKMAVALGWTSNSFDRIANGEPPELLDQAPASTAMLSGNWSRLNEARRRQINDLIDSYFEAEAE